MRPSMLYFIRCRSPYTWQWKGGVDVVDYLYSLHLGWCDRQLH